MPRDGFPDLTDNRHAAAYLPEMTLARDGFGAVSTRCRAAARAHWRAPAIVLATLALTACGFHLQGSGALPESGRSVYVFTPDELTPFAIELRRAIERSGGEIATTPEAAQTVVRVVKDRSGRRVLSVSARNTPQEYEIFYEVEYAVDRDGVEVIDNQPLRLLRNLSFEESQLLAKQREQAILEEAMARDLALQVVRRLESVSATKSSPPPGGVPQQ